MLNIYVGNIPFTAQESELRGVFGKFGEVTSVSVITDRETGRPRGFAFVEMADETQGRAAIAALNGSDMGGRALVVNEARPREARPPRSGGFSGGGGGGRSFGGGGSGGGGNRGFGGRGGGGGRDYDRRGGGAGGGGSRRERGGGDFEDSY